MPRKQISNSTSSGSVLLSRTISSLRVPPRFRSKPMCIINFLASPFLFPRDFFARRCQPTELYSFFFLSYLFIFSSPHFRLTREYENCILQRYYYTCSCVLICFMLKLCNLMKWILRKRIEYFVIGKLSVVSVTIKSVLSQVQEYL